jgi:hypothetical protein
VAPSKVIAFSWQLILNRIPTKDNLILREEFNLMKVWFARFVILLQKQRVIYSSIVELRRQFGTRLFGGLDKI